MTTDTIADLLTRIRNAHQARHKSVVVPDSKASKNVLNVLKDEGFIESYSVRKDAFGSFNGIDIVLKYYRNGEPAISTAKRASSPGRRLYRQTNAIPKVENGLGIAIISTSQGVMSDREARRKKVGGEVLALIS